MRDCIKNILKIRDDKLSIEIIIVDDGSKDNSAFIAQELMEDYPEVILISQKVNQGKGAALRIGFQRASGDFIAVQDARF